MACQLRLTKNWNKALLSWILAAERAAGWSSCQTERVCGYYREPEEQGGGSAFILFLSRPSLMETWWKSSSSQIWSSLQCLHPDLGTNLFICFHWTVSQFAYGYTKFSTWRNNENYQMWTCNQNLHLIKFTRAGSEPTSKSGAPHRVCYIINTSIFPHWVNGSMNKTFLCLLCL